MLVLVRWLLVVAPIGVFALALPLVARMGLSAVGALATYVVLVSLASAVMMLVVLYPAAALFGGVSVRASRAPRRRRRPSRSRRGRRSRRCRR